MKRAFLILITLMSLENIFAQNSLWNSTTFRLSKDTVSLEDMNGATTATFGGSYNATSLLDFPSGFSFRIGFTTYTQFSISAYGYIKLGGIPNFVNPTLQDTIISGLYAFPSTYPTCKYKMTGTAPNRKLVIEWIGTLSQSGAAHFQIWLYERIGRIQFVYKTIKSYALGNGYAIYCKAKVMNFSSVASIKTKPNNQLPVANYSVIEVNNYDSIYDKTRFTFQPDTVKPIQPGNLNSANVLPGCFNVVFTDNSTNESMFRVERLDTGTNYFFLKNIFSTTSASQGTVYSHSEIRMQPDSLYNYRVFATNGFVNSDTVYKNIRTPMPLISGTKKIPGDYTSINALLLDAECKHIGPNLVIELQSNYSYSMESTPVRFRRNLQTKVLRNVTVRPAIDASLILSSSTQAPLFTIDSVKYIGFDGRPGGIGNSIGMTIRQLDSLRPAISYVYYADSGILQYCNIEGRSRNNNFGFIYIGYKDPSWTNFPPGVSGTIIRNCKIGPTDRTSNTLLLIDNNGRGDSILIENNEFYRFKDPAIVYNFGGTGSRFSKNRFYQPEQISGSTFAITCADSRGYCQIDSNRIGGSVSAWGSGKWSSSGFAATIAMISYSSGLPQSSVLIKGNEFGNISLTNGTLEMIAVGNGKAIIENNKIGTADSVNSVVCQSHLYAIGLGGNGTKTVRNNFFSGMQADYPNRTGNQDLVMISSFFMDSLIIRGNDFGGSDYRFSNYTGGQARCISLGGIRNAIIIDNEIRGITSKNTRVFGIEQEFSGTSATEKNMIADSNRIHHLQGRLTVYGIYSRLYSGKKNTFSNNSIYALKGIGPSTQSGAVTNAITVEHFLPPNFNSPVDTSSVEIMNNKIYSLDYFTPSGVYPYQINAIAANGRKIRIGNNMLHLGIRPDGLPSDSLELEIRGILTNPVIRAEIEHNSIYIGGVGIESKGIDFPITTNTNGNKNIFVTNNIIQIDRSRSSSLSNGRWYMPVTGSGNSVVSNNNIWYGATDIDVANTLSNWRSRCQCDSSTLIANPQYINPVGDSLSQNLHLQPGSVADSSGTPSVGPVPKDIDNQVRVNYSPVDIGADAITPCSSNPATIQLQINPDKDYVETCAGTPLPLTVSVPGAVNQLQWQRNLNNINGATSSTYTVTQPGSYRVVGKLSCGAIASRTVVVVNGVTSPVVKLKSLTPAPYCDSGRITLQAEYINNTVNTPQIKWYKNNVLLANHTGLVETFDTIKVNDRYRVEVVNTMPCGMFTGKDSITITATSISYRPKIQIIHYDTIRCGTSTDSIKYRVSNTPFYFPVSVLFVTPAPGATVRNVGDSLLILENLPAQNLQIRLYNTPNTILQCFYPDTTQVITLNYMPVIAPVASLSGNNIVSSSSANNQWYSTPDNIIPGATSQSYTPTSSGGYFVRLIQGNCISEKSNVINFVYTGLPQINPPRQELQVFPNPTSGSVWLKSEILTETISFELIDATGRLLQEGKLAIQLNSPVALIFNTTAPGIYFLKVFAKQKIYLFKVVVF